MEIFTLYKNAKFDILKNFEEYEKIEKKNLLLVAISSYFTLINDTKRGEKKKIEIEYSIEKEKNKKWYVYKSVFFDYIDLVLGTLEEKKKIKRKLVKVEKKLSNAVRWVKNRVIEDKNLVFEIVNLFNDFIS